MFRFRDKIDFQLSSKNKQFLNVFKTQFLKLNFEFELEI